MSASEPGNSLYILFNFLDQSPQATSSGQGGGNDGYWTVVQAMQQHDQFLEGMLLKNVDERSEWLRQQRSANCLVSASSFEDCQFDSHQHLQ